jgi:hypothetical protein
MGKTELFVGFWTFSFEYELNVGENLLNTLSSLRIEQRAYFDSDRQEKERAGVMARGEVALVYDCFIEHVRIAPLTCSGQGLTT